MADYVKIDSDQYTSLPNNNAYNPQPQVYNPQPQVYNPQPQVYNPQPQVYNPQPQVYNPQPGAYSYPVDYQGSQPPVLGPTTVIIDQRPQVDESMIANHQLLKAQAANFEIFNIILKIVFVLQIFGILAAFGVMIYFFSLAGSSKDSQTAAVALLFGIFLIFTIIASGVSLLITYFAIKAYENKSASSMGCLKIFFGILAVLSFIFGFVFVWSNFISFFFQGYFCYSCYRLEKIFMELSNIEAQLTATGHPIIP